MNKLYAEYKDRGFTFLGFPCNQFMSQNPGTDEETQHVVCTKLKAEFPVLKRIDVNGDNESPLWTWLKKTGPGGFMTNGIKWNFTQFICDHRGVPVERNSPGVEYDAVKKQIEKLLVEAAGANAAAAPAAAAAGPAASK